MSSGIESVLGHYLVGLPIGHGRFGTVSHATDMRTAQRVALKLIRLHQPDSDEKVAAERHGALLQQQFGAVHRLLVPDVYEHGPMGDYYGIAMEYVPGRPLSAAIASGPMPPHRAARITLAIARFLHLAHRFQTVVEGHPYERIVHGDLKPDHILMPGDEEIRVLDFGIAKALEARSPETTNKWGSTAYASPERLQSDGHVNEHVDFWSLGVILFEMVAGFRPYVRLELSASRLERAIRTHEAMEPLPEGADPALAAVVRKLLATQIERRYQTAAEIVADVERYMAGQRTRAEDELAASGVETVRVGADGASAARVVPPVDIPTIPIGRTTPPPIPKDVRGAGLPGSPSGPDKVRSTNVDAKPTRKRGFLRRVAGFVLMASMLSEGIAFVRAERLRDQVPMLEPSDVPAIRKAYEDIENMAPLDIGTSVRVDSRLRSRMIELADRTIFDYRLEMPTVAEAQWREALDCLALARDLYPGDRFIEAKRLYVLGQLARISARAGEPMDDAIRYFHESARLERRLPDPYLGLARIAAYSTLDPAGLMEAIGEAQRRGYTAGRRERAQLGDVYKALGDRARFAARRLRPEERAPLLERALDYYEQCMQHFDGLDYFDSQDNHAACRRSLGGVNLEIARLPPQAETGSDGPGPSLTIDLPDVESR